MAPMKWPIRRRGNNRLAFSLLQIGEATHGSVTRRWRSVLRRLHCVYNHRLKIHVLRQTGALKFERRNWQFLMSGKFQMRMPGQQDWRSYLSGPAPENPEYIPSAPANHPALHPTASNFA